IIFDSLEAGHRKAITGTKIYVGDLKTETWLLDQVFEKEKPEAVIHFAAYIEVSESVKNPQKYFLNNVGGSLNLLRAMRKNKVSKLVFSSTAAVYGEPAKIPIEEDDPKLPTNPYGESKLMVEKILDWYARAYGLSSVALRYFNAAGASESYGEDHNPETHLIPLALKVALGKKEEFKINGDDFDTPDGTGIRDYIHVLDLAQAHLDALNFLKDKKGKFTAYNVGTGQGHSVLEVVRMVKKISGIDFKSPIGPRREGDPARLVAKAEKIKKDLGWQPRHSDLKTIVESAWKWHQGHPGGYQG
ncbi:MAG TPA: UDP-glucose 4-epimerase GalE, partial [Candidatus Bathyarchaeia archaeon]|nr:UDP-glucose 4-epimerase GalE [Candidatus Bathyarchaeia archaeon]